MTEKKICEATGKVCYSRREAGEAIGWFRNGHFFGGTRDVPKRYYLCPFCGTYHLTHYKKKRTEKKKLKEIYR